MKMAKICGENGGEAAKENNMKYESENRNNNEAKKENICEMKARNNEKMAK